MGVLRAGFYNQGRAGRSIKFIRLVEQRRQARPRFAANVKRSVHRWMDAKTGSVPTPKPLLFFGRRLRLRAVHDLRQQRMRLRQIAINGAFGHANFRRDFDARHARKHMHFNHLI